MKLIIALFSALGFFLPALQSPVPVANEPKHHLKFENQYVRVFDVVVPPGETTLFHTHSNDYVFVSIGDANLKGEVQGAAPADLILKDGEVRFTKATLTHRVTNQSGSPFRNITIEILKSPGEKSPDSMLEKSAGHTLVLDNDRVRVYRLVLEPGQTTGPMHTHTKSGLGVAVTGGKVVFHTSGQKPQLVEFKPGDFQWRSGRLSHSIRNAGTTRFEAVDIEWK
jgi:quercetin dioxygenase-like cupin family protein